MAVVLAALLAGTATADDAPAPEPPAADIRAPSRPHAPKPLLPIEGAAIGMLCAAAVTGAATAGASAIDAHAGDWDMSGPKTALIATFGGVTGAFVVLGTTFAIVGAERRRHVTAWALPTPDGATLGVGGRF